MPAIISFNQEVIELFKMPKKMVYALPEIIGNTDLFVGRKKEFDYFFGTWYQDLEKNFPQNQAIISRRKKGKTAFLQRLFNIFWSAYQKNDKDSITVIPFYYSIHDTPVKLGAFAEEFYIQFLKCYLSCTKRMPELLTSEKHTKYLKNLEKKTIGRRCGILQADFLPLWQG
jgi:hypothetical protein